MTDTDTQPTTDGSPAATTTAEADAEADPDTIAAERDLLADENRRLRAEYARARQSQYRTTAIGLAAIGLLAMLGGLVLPGTRDVLLALGATGLFGALLTYYLTPTRFVAADVGERVYAAAATNLATITAELGLRDERLYVPAETEPARLYVPQSNEATVPDDRAGPFVVDDDSRGLLLDATGSGLFREFNRSLTGDLAHTPQPLTTQLIDGLAEQFELVDAADTEVDATDGRATIAITDSAFGAPDRFDHPIPSFLAVGLTTGLDRPVRLEVAPGDDRADWLLTYRWTPGPDTDPRETPSDTTLSSDDT